MRTPNFEENFKIENTNQNVLFCCEFADCKREFNSKRNLVDHCKGHHQGRKPHPCSFPGCEKSFLRPAHLLIHTRIHTGEKPFLCEYEGCGKRWNQKSALKQHLRSHTGEKPFRCSIRGCTKSFTTSSSCKRHVSTHYQKSIESNKSKGDWSSLTFSLDGCSSPNSSSSSSSNSSDEEYSMSDASPTFQFSVPKMDVNFILN